MQHEVLLPNNATAWELLVSDVTDELVRLADQVEGIRVADEITPAQFLPWLVYEYGLGELSPFLPNLNDLITQGIRWQRVRGTPAAIALGLGWLGYSATLEEEPARHRRWNRFQIELDRVRDRDLQDLRQIEGIVSLSPPARSHFLRGFRDYDIRACESSYQKTGASLFSDHSGVPIPGGVAKWSFGRLYQRDTTLSQADLTALGTWIPAVAEGVLWVNDNTLWTSETFLWAVPAAQARRLAIATALTNFDALIRFTGAGGTIGYARAFSHRVRQGSGGYSVLGTDWTVDDASPTAVFVGGASGFGDGAGQTATSMAVVLGATRGVGVPPGKLWLAPSEVSGGTAVASTSVSIPFGLTVRERAQFILRF